MSKLYGVEGTLYAVNCTFYLLGSKYNFKNCKYYLFFCKEPMDYGSTSVTEEVFFWSHCTRGKERVEFAGSRYTDSYAASRGNLNTKEVVDRYWLCRRLCHMCEVTE